MKIIIDARPNLFAKALLFVSTTVNMFTTMVHGVCTWQGYSENTGHLPYVTYLHFPWRSNLYWASSSSLSSSLSPATTTVHFLSRCANVHIYMFGKTSQYIRIYKLIMGLLARSSFLCLYIKVQPQGFRSSTRLNEWSWCVCVCVGILSNIISSNVWIYLNGKWKKTNDPPTQNICSVCYFVQTMMMTLAMSWCECVLVCVILW